MTMVNAVVQGDRAYLYADTAVVDPRSGVLIAFAPKLWPGKHFPWALGVTFNGPVKALRALHRLDDACTAAEVARQLPKAVQQFKKKARAAGERQPIMRLVAVCWDASGHRPRIYVAGDGLEAIGSPPDAVEMDYFFGADGDAAEEIAATIHGRDISDPKQFHPVNDGIAAFESRRGAAYRPLGNCKPGVHVGGKIDMAEVSSAGALLYTIHEWPEDVVGRLIHDPEGRPCAR